MQIKSLLEGAYPGLILIGVLAFLLGISLTLFCYLLRGFLAQREKTEK